MKEEWMKWEHFQLIFLYIHENIDYVYVKEKLAYTL